MNNKVLVELIRNAAIGDEAAMEVLSSDLVWIEVLARIADAVQDDVIEAIATLVYPEDQR